LSLARLDQTAADREVTRLEANTGAKVAAAVAGGRRRWQAEELRKALENAKTHLRDAGGHVVREEAALRQAMLADVSRLEAWAVLSAIFTLINFVGAYAIGRVLEKWRATMRRQRVTPKPVIMRALARTCCAPAAAHRSLTSAMGFFRGGDRDVEQGLYVPS